MEKNKTKTHAPNNASHKTASFYTSSLPCWSLCRHHSSIHALHPWVNGCATCSALQLWLPQGDHEWAQAASHLCLCGLCHGVRCGEEEVAQLCGPFQSSWGNAQSQSSLCEEQGDSSLPLAHHQTGCVLKEKQCGICHITKNLISKTQHKMVNLFGQKYRLSTNTLPTN